MDGFLTTKQFADALGITPDTLRRALCVGGSYFGVIPIKMPNRRLIWPTEGRDRLVYGRKGPIKKTDPESVKSA